MGVVGGAVALSCARPSIAWAAELSVPPQLQAQLFTKVAKYDRNMGSRGSPPFRVLLLEAHDDARSSAAGRQFEVALRGIGKVGSSAIEVERAPFAGESDLRDKVRRAPYPMVYLMPGLEPEAASVASAMASLSVLSAGANRLLTSRGAVVGFDLEGGRPVILVHRARAGAQQVALASDVLRLAEVIG